MGDDILSFVEKICTGICSNTFENSNSSCIQKHTENRTNTTSTLQQIELQKEIIQYCQIHKNRFWILYYTRTQSEIEKICRKCAGQQDKCKNYILDKIVKHIKTFNTEQESVVFAEVRTVLQNNMESTEGIVNHYVQKLHNCYVKKNRSIDQSIALVENALEHCEDVRYEEFLDPVLDACKTYSVSMSLEEIMVLAFKDDTAKVQSFNLHLYEELLQLEKFANYIKKVIQSRFIDFTRSKASELIVSDELEEHMIEEETETEEEYDEALLQTLNEEQTLISKLKYGFRLDNKEFVTVIIKLGYEDVDLLKDLTSEEKFYIKLVTKYALADDSEQLKHFDVPTLQNSIHIKITQERERLQSHSYSEYEESEKKEIYFKLLYAEGMNSKEMGLIFDLTAKQIDKKIENSKKKLKGTL